MNKQLLKYVALLAVLTLACNTLIGPMPTPAPPAILHFENDFVSFDYPAGMLVFNSGDPAFITYPIIDQLGGQLVAGLADPQEMSKNGYLYRVVGIFRHMIPFGESAEKVMEDAYLSVNRHDGWVKASGPVTFAGLPAYQETYGVYGGEASYEMRDIWVEKDDVLIRASIWTPFHNPENFAAFQSLTAQILNSLVIKDNLPPILETPTPESTPSPTPFPASMIAHFENDVVAFDYLKKMKVHTANDPAFKCYPDFQLGGELVVGLGDPNFTGFGDYFRSIRILHQQIPAGSNLEAIMLDTYRMAADHFPQENGVLNANGVITVGGFSAVQRTYRVYSGEPAYELRDIWLQKDNELFIIAIWTEYTNPDDFAAFQAGAEAIIKSLIIK